MRRITIIASITVLLITTGLAQVDHFAVTIPGLDSIPPQTAGIPFYIQVVARDSINNTVTDFSGTIEISSNGNLLSPAISKPFVNGVLDSMIIIFKNTGLFFLIATGTDEGQTGISNEFPVAPNAPFAIGVETAPDGTGAILSTQSVTAGRQLVAYAIIRDSLNNFINITAADSWSLQNITGGVTSADLVPSGDRRAAFFTAHKIGTAQIHAVSGSLHSTNSGTLTVTAGAASRLSFVQQPSNTVNNSPITPSVTVQVEDSQGNPIPAAGDTVTLSLSGTGTLQGSTQQLTDATGLATYSGLSINLLGSKRLVATSSGLTADTTTSFTILPGPLNNFLVESSAGGSIPEQTAGTPFSIRVTARDQANNTATSFTGTIQLSSGGNLLSSVVSKPFVNGVLDSMTVIVGNTGSFTVTATNTAGAQTGVSNTFSVVPNVAFRVSVETASNGTGAVLAGQSIAAGQSLTAYAITRDSLNNFIANVSADSWALQNITGGVSSSDLVPSGDNKSAVFTGHRTGTAQIHATSGALQVTNSGTLAVTAGVASRLSFVQQPTNTVNNSAVTPSVTVQVEDAQGNAISTAGDTITLSMIGTGTLQGSTQQLTDATGLATYSGLSINLLGPKRLVASANGLAPDTSVTFTILTGPLNNFLVESSSGGSIPTQAAGAPFSIRVTARDLANNTVTSFNGKIQISSTGNLLNSIISPPFVNGILDSMIIIIGNTGSFALTATNTAGLQAGISNTFAVVPNVAFRVSVESAPDGSGIVVPSQSVPTGQVVTAYAIARDSLNNFVTNISADAWTLQNIAGGVLLTDLVASSDKKSAQFTGHKTGSAQIHVTSGTLASTNSGTLTVTAGVAARLGFIQQPTNAVSDSAISPPVTVQIEDIAGNPVPGSGDSITVSLIGTGSMQGTAKVQAGVTGLATYSSLTIDLIGTKRLVASANAFLPDTSTSFTISPGPVSSFLVESSAGGVIPTQTAGTPFSIRVTARDQGGNTATGFSGTVNITSSGTLSAGGGTTPAFASGVLASYSVTMLQGGTFTISATQTSGSASGTSGSFTVNNPIPTTTSITPNLKTVLDAGFTLTVNGTNFVPTSTSQINGSDRVTTYVNGTQLTVAVLTGDLATAETLAVTVTSPSPGGGVSNSQQLVVANLTIVLKAFLQGPFSAGSMSTALRTSGLIPLSQPFTVSPWNYSGTEHVAAIPANVVDWILLELRTGTTGATKVASRAGFLLSNGSIVDLDGASPVMFSGIGAGNYYVVLRHRNHLAAMSASPLPLSAVSASYDFTVAQARAFGTAPMASLAGGVFGLYAGDVNANGTLKYSGGGNDSGPIYARIGGGSVSATVSGYFPEDTNMNGVVKYSGAQNDRAIIYANIGGGSVSATLTTQVPP